MNLKQKIKHFVKPVTDDVLVVDVRIGLGYTAVCLDDGRTGLAYTYRTDISEGCNVLNSVASLAGQPVSNLVDLVDSDDVIASAVGLAACNAIMNTKSNELLDGDILNHIKINSNDNVGMIGYFRPMVKALREMCASLFIFELIDEPENGVLPAHEAPAFLPDCQVILISSTSIVNNTIDDILKTTSTCRELVMLGPSTPLVPQAFSGTPVTLLSGVIVIDAPEVLRVVSEGGGMRRFKDYILKVNMRLS